MYSILILPLFTSLLLSTIQRERSCPKKQKCPVLNLRNSLTMISTYLPKPQSNCPSPYRLIRTLSFHFFYWILLSSTTLTVPTTCCHSILPKRSSSTTSDQPSKNSKFLKFLGSPGARAKSMRLDFTIMPQVAR